MVLAIVFVVLAVGGIALLAWDWRRSSRLKHRLASGQAPGGGRHRDARHGTDAAAHHARGLGDQSHGAGHL